MIEKIVSKLDKDTLELAKGIANVIWLSYHDLKAGNYQADKIERNNNVNTDVNDNIWMLWNQFDVQNQEKFIEILLASRDCKAKEKLMTFIKEQEEDYRNMVSDDMGGRDNVTMI